MEERSNMIREESSFQAEKDGFQGDPTRYGVETEAAVDRRTRTSEERLDGLPIQVLPVISSRLDGSTTDKTLL